MSWSDLTNWWLAELEADESYEKVVTPLLVECLQANIGSTYLDIACGEGRVQRFLASLGIEVHGLDINPDLVSRLEGAVVGSMMCLPIRAGTFDGVYSVLALEHVEDHVSFFLECARVTKPAGVLAIVLNHPIWTAPESTPITDEDGEVLWRPGEYFSRGSSTIPAGNSTVTFHHRSMSELLNAAANGGWSLEHLIELPHHEFEDQSGIPRLLACRWRLLP